MPESFGRGGQHPAIEITELSTDDCWARLTSHELGRLAFVANGRAEIFPVNYRADNGHVVFRSAEGTKVAAAPGVPAAFEIDGWEAQTGVGWSVVVHGIVLEITDAADHLGEHLRELVVRPVAPGQRSHWLALYADEISGRQFTSGWQALMGGPT